MATTAEHLKTLSVYAPPPVARLAFQDPQRKFEGFSRRFLAATVFADISGFTPLAEALASSGGVRGAEELTAILNRVFEALITTVENHGGQVVKFGGDALSLIWPCDENNMAEAVWRAVQSAFAMQTAMINFATVTTTQGEFELRMKIGVSVGELLEVHAGGEFSRWEYVLAGPPMENMSSAENLAAAGQVVVDEAAWRLLNGRTLTEISSNSHQLSNTESYAFGEEMAPGFYGITHLWSQIPSAPLPPPDWSRLDPSARTKVATTLRGYIPGAISSILESGHGDMLAELKPMTVCFLGFSGIDYHADPNAGPRLSEFMRDAQKMIYHYEGSLNKLAVGDKGSVLLVLFGAPPFFHEDDEVRGVACASALLKVAARYNLQARIGLTTGTLFAGPLGAPQRREYSVIGDMVNLAARLMQKAEPGEVWVDQSVQSKTVRFFEYEDLGSVQVKGKTEPRHVYKALGEKDQEELVIGYLLSNQELTGREKELEIFDALADKVYKQQGQVLLLSGEAGVGKSRLAAEIVRRWMTLGGASHGGDCVSYGRQTPYLPWRGIVASIAGLSPRLPVKERLARLERLLHRMPRETLVVERELSQAAVVDQPTDLIEDYWLERLPLVADMLGLESEETELTAGLSEDLRRDNIFEIVRAIILQEAQQRPTLILLEDIHWSDELSMELAVHLADAIRDQPILFVLAHRPLGDPLPVTYQRIQQKPYATEMGLTELNPEAALKLVQSKLGVKSLPPDLADLLKNKGQGNPFFIEELVNSLLTMEVIRVEYGECQIIGDLDKLEMPDTVQKVILARIDRLDEADKVTLKVAAAIGRTFQRDLLETVHPWVTSEHSLDEQLARLQAEDFTRQEVRESDLDFLFKHVITQEVAYETMLYSQRRQLHATIGLALENRGNNSDGEVVDLLAYHYSRSDNRDKALHYLHRAGQKALAGYANEAAISYFTEALTVAEETQNVKVQYDLLAGREQAYNRMGNRVAQDQDLKQMKQLALAENDVRQQLEVGSRQLQLATNLGRYSEATEIAYETLNLAQQTNHPDWEARVLTNLGITSWRRGDYSRARRYLQQALDRLSAQDDQQLRATSLNYLGLIDTQICEYDQARHSYQAALAIYRDIGDRAGEAGCANNLGLLESSLGRYLEAQQYYNQALSICHAIGDRLREGISLNTLGQAETILGHYERAEELLDRSLAIRRAIGDRRGEAFGLHDVGFLYLTREQPQAAIHHFQAACDLRRDLGENGNYVASLAMLGQSLLLAGQVSKAVKSLQEAVTYLQNNSGSGEYPPQNAWWIYSRVCRANGQTEAGYTALRKAYELVRAKAEQINDLDLRQSYLINVRYNASIIDDMASSGIMNLNESPTGVPENAKPLS